MAELPIRYLVGGSCGIIAFIVVTPFLGVPSSFLAFVVRTLALLLGASVFGSWIFDRYVADESARSRD